MVDPIFIITKHEFDNMENSLSKARYSEIVGFSESEEQANKFVLGRAMERKHRGWDGVTYPVYKISKVGAI
jgi:hypothetical protein